MKNYKIIFTGIILIILLIGAYYAFSNNVFSDEQENSNSSEAFIVVNDEEVSVLEFDQFYIQMAQEQGIDLASLDLETAEQVRSQAIDFMISQLLLRQEAEKSGIVANEEEIDSQLSNIRNQFPDIAEYDQALAEEGISEENLRLQITRNLLVQKFIDQELNIDNIEVTDEEAQALYSEASSMQENFPPLEDIREQVDQTILRQKQQELITDYIEELKKDANIKINS